MAYSPSSLAVSFSGGMGKLLHEQYVDRNRDEQTEKRRENGGREPSYRLSDNHRHRVTARRGAGAACASGGQADNGEGEGERDRERKCSKRVARVSR